MDRQMVVNLIRNEVVECPQGKSKLWVVRCFEITAHPGKPAVTVDEYEVCEVCEDGDGERDGCCSPARMYHVGRSVIHLEDKRVVEEPVRRGWVEVGSIPVAR